MGTTYNYLLLFRKHLVPAAFSGKKTMNCPQRNGNPPPTRGEVGLSAPTITAVKFHFLMKCEDFLEIYLDILTPKSLFKVASNPLQL